MYSASAGERSSLARLLLRTGVFALAMALLAGEYYVWPEHAADSSFPVNLVFLGAMYIGFAVTVDNFAVRYAWPPRVVMLFGAFVGVVLEGFFQRSFYADEPRILGVNWLTVAIMCLYWGVLAAAVARYSAERLVPVSRQGRPVRRGFLVGLAAWWTALLLVWGVNLDPLTEPGAILVALLAVGLLARLVVVSRSRERAEPKTWPRNQILDVAIAAYVVLELLAGTAAAPLEQRIGMWILTGTILGIIGVWTLWRVEVPRASEMPSEMQ